MAYLGYIYNKDLTEQERNQMDSQVHNNQKIFIYGLINVVVAANCLTSSAGAILPLPPPISISRPISMKENDNQPSITVSIQPKADRLTLKQVESSNDLEKGSITMDQAIEKLRGGDLGKGSNSGARAKADARRNFNAGKFSFNILPVADGFVQQRTFCRIHENAPLACKPKVEANGPFQNNGNNPPPETSPFDFSQHKGGPSPFRDKFNYDNPNFTRENTDFSNKKRMNHSYDEHAKKCFNIQENRNNQNLQKFEKSVRDYIESPETQKINGSYRYETPAYHYKNPNEDLIVTVNATNNQYISVRNATEFQLDNLNIDGNIGLDNRPSMILKLRGPGPKL